MNQNNLKKIVIVGGGTAGWIAASTLGNIFKNSNTKIELVESPDVGVIGVGEATIPPFLRFLSSIGIDEVDFIKKTQSTFKLGIDFKDWHTKGESYFHPFGHLGRTIDGHDFFQCWLKCHAKGDSPSLMSHSPEAILAKDNRFFLPHKSMNTPMANVNYALHLDSTLVGQYLRNFAENIGVIRHEAHVNDVHLDDRGFIHRLSLNNNKTISGDFFIDCTGFQGLLIEKTLKAGYDDWSDFLPCNRAVTVQSESSKHTKPYTISAAKDAGWTWRIPLQHRTGNGYVFCSHFCTDEEATETLLSGLDTRAINEPRIIPFTTGIRKEAWKKNCLALGLAQGFIEPLESTAIHLVSKSLAFFVRLFPDATCQDKLASEFNRRLRADYEEIRDFLILHYCQTDRDDTEFWRWCKTMPKPESLQKKIDFFQLAGGLIPEVDELFQPTSWYSVFTGMGVTPEGYNPTIDALDYSKLRDSLHKGSLSLIKAAESQPNHDDFIKHFCASPDLEQIVKSKL